MKNLPLKLMFLSLILICDLAASAQQLPTKDDTKEVFIDVSVLNGKQNFIVNLDQEFFEVFQDKKPVKITSFERPKNEPMTVGLLFDMSGSMSMSTGGRFQKVPMGIEGMKYFISESNKNNEYFLMTFGKRSELLQEITENKNLVLEKLAGLSPIEPHGHTNLFDTMGLALEKLSHGKYAKKALIIFSDFMDNNSTNFDFDDIKRLTKLHSTAINVVNFVGETGTLGYGLMFDADGRVHELIEYGGGNIYYARNRDQNLMAFGLVAYSLIASYRIGFIPENDGKKGKWHKIKVNVSLPEGLRKQAGKITIKSRQGYFQ